MTVDRGLLDKAVNIINNVGNYGPLDATIDSYKQAADYADDARKYSEIAASGVENLNVQIAKITELTTRVEEVEEEVEKSFEQVTTLDVAATSGSIASATYDKEENIINFVLPKGVDGKDGTDGESTYQLWIKQPGNEGKAEAEFLASLEGRDGLDGKDGIDGTNGYSAYELAVISGYQGTLEDFNNLNTKSLSKDQNLSDLDNVATARANLQVPSKTESTAEINAAVSSKASKGANADITALSGLTVALSIAQGGTGSKTATDARTALVAAKSGGNSDITSLSGFGSNVVLRSVNASEGLGTGVVFDCSNATEASFGITNTGGGTAVFHNYSKNADGSATGSGALIGGYGARPWIGNTYSPHSTSAIHFMQDGLASATNHGGWLRFVTTPLNKTVDFRTQPLAVSNNGDIWVGKDVPLGVNSMSSSGFGGDNTQNWDGRGLKQCVGPYNDINFLTPANGDTSPSVTIRGTPFGGTAGGSKSATPGTSAMWIGLDGHNGTNFVPMTSSIRFIPSSQQNWSSSNTGAGMIFSTTALNSTTRTDRWSIGGDGTFNPLVDNSLSIGSANLRLSAIFAANGAIQTSDARLKSEVRGFNDKEIEAAKLIGREVGFFSWLESQEEKGDSAREHVGLTVQRAMEIMKSCDLDPLHYGFICHNTWDESKVVSHYENDTNNPVYKTVPAGDRYSFRYDQLNLFIARGFEARLSALESK